MTINELREFNSLAIYLMHDMRDTAARSLSALIRASTNNKDRNTFGEYAKRTGLINHPEFIV